MANSYNGCNNNCEAVAELQDKAANLVSYSNLINSWLNGPANGTVNIAGVNTPTLLKLVTDLRNKINQMPQSILLQNGGIAVDANGKLYVDFNSMPPNLLYQLLQKIVLQEGGLAFNSDGKLFVDFDTMPTNRFEAILETFRKGLRLPKWLTANKDFYVNQNHAMASDELGEGRGESASLPFASIQACVNYVADNYNMANFTATIHVASGEYYQITLGDFSRSTGKVVIAGSGANTIIKRTNIGFCITGNGGNWEVRNFKINNNVDFTGITNLTTSYGGGIVCNAGNLLCSGLDVSVNQTGTNATGRTRSYYGYLAQNSGSLTISPGSSRSKISFAFDDSSFNKYAIAAETGNLTLGAVADSSLFTDILCNGDFTAFARAASKGNILRSRSQVNQTTFSGNCTGMRYRCQTGGSIDTGGAGPDYFPGNSAGTVETANYSWYS